MSEARSEFLQRLAIVGFDDLYGFCDIVGRMERAMQRATCQKSAGPLFNRLLRCDGSGREMKVEASDSYPKVWERRWDGSEI